MKAALRMVLFVLLLLHSYAQASTIQVTSTGDSGTGTLREAISSASSGDTIVFNLPVYPATITLSSQLIIVLSDLTISGPGADKLTISGDHSSRVFLVNAGEAVTIQGLTVANGYADLGGGISNNGGTNIIVENSTFSDNHAFNHGGGLYNDRGTMSVINSTIASNTAVFFGGGIENYQGEMIISGSTITDNSAAAYGGIHNQGTMEISNSTITNNTSSPAFNCGPSGIFNSSPGSGALEIINSTIVGNKGNVGNYDSCYASGGDIIISNSILADSISLGNCMIKGGVADGTTHNLSTDDSCGTGFTQLSFADLALGPLQDNGGLAHTMALLNGSAAIDGADDEYCPDIDQRGVTRPQGAHCDIGAYEVTVTIGLESSANPSDYGQSVTFTATVLVDGSIPAGTVTFKDGGLDMCSDVALSSGIATCDRSSLSGGDHIISAEFTGASGSSGSGFLTQTVHGANQTITVTASAPANAGYNTTFVVAADSDSGLGVAITTEGRCTGSGIGSAVITMTCGIGSCMVYYNQAGNSSFNAASEITEITAVRSVLTMTLSGTGMGTVTGDGIDCSWNGTESSGTCWCCYNDDVFDLHVVTGECSFFDGWETAYTENGNSSGVTVRFEKYPLVRFSPIQGRFANITGAYTSSPDGGTIQIQSHAFGEDLILSRPVNVIFDSGWNCDYTRLSGFAAVKSLTMTDGSIVFKNGPFIIGP